MSVGVQMICGGVLLLIVSVSTGEAGRFEWSNVSVRSILAWWYLVIFGAIIAFTVYVWLVRVCAPSLVGTYAFVNPVIAVFLGSAFAGEELNFRKMCGAAVLWLRLLWSSFSRTGQRNLHSTATSRNCCPALRAQQRY